MFSANSTLMAFHSFPTYVGKNLCYDVAIESPWCNPGATPVRLGSVSRDCDKSSAYFRILFGGTLGFKRSLFLRVKGNKIKYFITGKTHEVCIFCCDPGLESNQLSAVKIL